MKNIKGLVLSGAIVIILTVVTILAIKQGKSQTTKTEELESKVHAELQYLDNKILSMLNGLNNILLRNYIVSSYEIGESTEESDNESSGVTKNSDETEIEADSASTDNENKINIHQLKSVGILTSNKDANWESLKAEIEILYSSWNTIILDLYKLNINSEDILKFSSVLDKATMYIREENKEKALATLSELYSYIPVYMESYSNDNKEINIQKTKSNIMRAYSVVDSKNWNEVNAQLVNAENSYLNVLNSNTTEDYSINKGYILLKELQNSVAEKDEDIFYIKYKNLLEKLNNIS